jgi:hypothetical protein
LRHDDCGGGNWIGVEAMRDTIDMAREAGWTSYDSQDERFKAFEALVRADEREACAKVCYELPWKDMDHIPSNLAFAAAIRARGNT